MTTNLAEVRLDHALSSRVRTLRIDLADIHWLRHGRRYGAVTPAVRDLSELALLVHEIDRRLPKRIVADRVRGVEVTVNLREPHRWTPSVLEALGEVLYLQGNAEWRFRIGQRDATGEILEAADPNPDPIDKAPAMVALFSGGLDSTSGLAMLQGRADEVIALSFYSSGNFRKQQQILAALGFRRHAQVRGEFRTVGGRPRSGGAFNYRAFLFLALAAAEAATAGVTDIYQFENGPLALAIPPAPLFRITRHAHPTVQRRAADLFSEVLGAPIRIHNPALGQTKRETVADLRQVLGAGFPEILKLTETCWYLKAVGVVGGPSKSINQPCGSCIPCLVRRTAVGDDDPTDPRPLTSDPIHRVNVDAYLNFAERLLDQSYGEEEFLRDAPWVTAQALRDGVSDLTLESALALYRRFAGELGDSFTRV